MGRTRKSDEEYKTMPAITVEGQENILINHAIKLAERQLIDGTASPSVIVHYLKLGSPKAQAERELLEAQIEQVRAKTEALRGAKRAEELFAEAMRAFSMYRGEDDPDDTNLL